MQDRVAGLLVAALGTAVALYARTFPPMPGQRIGPALFPTIVGLLLVVLGIVLAVARAGSDRGMDRARETRSARREMQGRFAAVVGVLVLYVAGVDWLGFILTGICFLSALMLVFGVRRSWILPMAAAVTLAIHYSFYTVLRVPLPWGLLDAIAW